MSDKITALQAELAKSKAICANPNASKYHKERCKELESEIAKSQPKKEAPKKDIPHKNTIPDEVTT